ncbi:MAG: orotidine-5'-phosphate decarboxylase [Phycisphaerae bacterium]|nr:orotidine-5'-phosphate decarboxylase [Phycisphaerae bacterium]
MTHFADRLADAIDRAGSPVCVGLDPVVDRLPEEVRSAHWEPARAIAQFCSGVLEAVAGVVPAVKVQSACFERYGAEGVRTLEGVLSEARGRGLVTVLDAKRGDIGMSAEHYAAAAFEHARADALTVSGYLGPDTLAPYSGGVFVLVRTSNPGSDAVQSQRLADGRTVAEMMADHVRAIGEPRRGARGLSDVGAVVGATKPEDGPALRARMPDQVFLVPGYGAQGGTPDDVRGMRRPGARSPGESGLLVTASRSVIYPGGEGDWRQSIRGAARRLASEVGAIALRP